MLHFLTVFFLIFKDKSVFRSIVASIINYWLLIAGGSSLFPIFQCSVYSSVVFPCLMVVENSLLILCMVLCKIMFICWVKCLWTNFYENWIFFCKRWCCRHTRIWGRFSWTNAGYEEARRDGYGIFRETISAKSMLFIICLMYSLSR